MAVKIFIDQGHNPVNPNAGAEGHGYREQDLVYTIGLQLAKLLRADGRFEVLLSRPTAETQLGTSNASSLAARVNLADNWGADYFISLHANASDISSASGSEAFVYALDSDAFTLADNILIQLSNATGLENRGVFVRPSLYVIRRTAMPSVLVELGFITNAYDAALMYGSPDKFALGVFSGILAYLGYL
jgi:N-acetylmuramoyl-L-alanine amidase